MPDTIQDLSVLECYQPLIDIDADVYLLWGGRDRGASHFTAQRLILDCLKDDYFRCVLVRKTYESIRDSQYQTIKDIVEANNMSHLFTFLKSPLEIRCYNGNKFIARGCDNPVKLKSIKDPNVCHIEEADQLTEEDYIVVHTTLRHEWAKVREWLSFNSDFMGDYEDHFIWRYYLQNIPSTYQSGLYDTDIEVPVGGIDGDTITETIRYYSMHGTYHQNPYCPPSRRATYEALKDQNQYYYNVYVHGILGKKKNEHPWFWALSRDKHYRPDVYNVDKNYNIVISLDFNHDPCAMILSQNQSHILRYNKFAYFKASSTERESAIKQLCDRFIREFPHHHRTKQITLTGDSTGRNKDANRPTTVNRYTEACQYLGVNRSCIKIRTKNPLHKLSRDLDNYALNNLPKGGIVYWGGRGIEMLLTEMESAYPDNKETLNKAKAELGLHGVDADRYLNLYFFAHGLLDSELPQHKKRINDIARRLNSMLKS